MLPQGDEQMNTSPDMVARVIGDNYNQHVKSTMPGDFWGQVKRHVFGQPIADEQIQLIVEAIHDALDLNRHDILLDLACGNGALTAKLQPACEGCFGVDVSEALIEIANTNFARSGCCFVAADVASYVLAERDPARFTKALCYGSFPYLHPASASLTLAVLAGRFPNLERVFVGNLPDLSRVQAFYPQVSTSNPGLQNPLSDIGIWRSRQEFVELAAAAGWSAKISVMPTSFYAAHYRYDALLTRSDKLPLQSEP